MNNLGVDPDIAAKIWFTSLDYLPKGKNAAKFTDCRYAVIAAAYRVVKYSEQDEVVRKIKTAFNRSQIINEREKPGDLNNDGRVDTTDLSYIKQAVKGSRQLDSNQKAQADLDFNGMIDSNDADLLNKYTTHQISNF